MSKEVKLVRDTAQCWDLPVTVDDIQWVALWSVDDENVNDHEWVTRLAAELTPAGFDVYVDTVMEIHEAS